MLNNLRVFFNFIRHQKIKNNKKIINFSILLFHRIVPEIKNDLLGTCIDVDSFRKIIKYLSLNYNIINPKDFNSLYESNKIQKNSIILSFDDGFIDNYTFAFPILKEFNTNAVFFLPTNYISKKNTTWDWEIKKIIDYNYSELIEKHNFFLKLNNKSKKNILWNCINYLKNKNINYRNDFIQETYKLLKIKNSFNENDRCLNWTEVNEMQSKGMLFGSHTHNHTSLLGLKIDEIESELMKSKKLLEEHTKTKCNYFSYPFGSYNDFDNKINKLVHDIGYTNIFSNIQGSNDLNKNVNYLKRVIIKNKIDKYKLFF